MIMILFVYDKRFVAYKINFDPTFHLQYRPFMRGIASRD